MSMLDDLAGRVESLTAALAHHLDRRTLLYTLLFAALTAVSVVFVLRLELKSDFMELLPDHYQSVQDLKLIQDKVGGLGYLSIAVESSDVKSNERFADDLAKVLHERMGDRLRYVDYRSEPIERFYKDHAALYMSLDDLEEVRRRLQAHLDAERRDKLPLFADILDEGDRPEPAPIDFSDLQAKYENKARGGKNYIDGYYTGEDGRLLAMLVRLKAGSSTSMTALKKLIDNVNAAAKTLDMSRYAPDQRYELSGSYKIGLEEYETLKQDIVGTALLCVALISAAIFLFFRRLRAVLLLGVAAVAAVLWTFAVTYFAIGYVNTVTAFLGAIIAGTGINYGIILLARYFEERRLGRTPAAAVETAMQKTIIATFGASATTAVAFGVFGFSELRSFSQFGFIGGVGVMLLWVASYTMLPAMVVLSEEVWSSVSAKSDKGALLSDDLPLGPLPLVWRHPRPVLIGFALATAASIAAFVWYVPGSLEYDISRLRTKSSMDSGTAKLGHRISEVFSTSMTPAVLYAGSRERSREVCQALYAIKARDPENAGIERCRSIDSLLPDRQTEKLVVIADIRRLIAGDLLKLLPEKQKQQVEELRRNLPDRPLGVSDLPNELSRFYIDRDGKVGTFVYVDPHAGRNLWNAKNLQRFTDDIRRIKLPSGEVMTSSGEAVIFADLLGLLKRDSPRATLAAFIGVFLVVVAIFRGLRPAVFVSAAVLVGASVMGGLMAAFGVKLNFFNFMALPMTFGIGVDYSINLYQRYLEEGRGHIEKAMRRTGTAVFLCSLTTIIGYFVLIIGDSRALVSLGMLAILGEFTCLAAALVALPALVSFMERRRS